MRQDYKEEIDEYFREHRAYEALLGNGSFNKNIKKSFIYENSHDDEEEPTNPGDKYFNRIKS